MSCLHRRYTCQAALLGALLLFLSLSLNFSKAAVAATTTLNATINAGTLNLVSPSVASISAVTLEGVDQASTGSLGAVAVTDNRGTGAGWSVTAAVSDFSCCDPARVIEVKNLTLNPGALTVVSGKGLGVAAGSSRTFVSTTEAVTLMTAVSGSGMGSYRVTPTISLSIPADAFAGVYTATLTVTVI